RPWRDRAAAGAAAAAGRGTDRRTGARPRRHRAAPPGPRADDQGRDDPGEPSPGQEQPADRRGPAAPAGPPVTTADARAALEESVRRVGSIAIVHEILSMSVDEVVEFDGIVDRIAAAAVEVAAPETKVRLRRDSSFGALPAEIATPLAMILNELLLNAVEHGFTGSAEDAEVVISAHRFRRQLHVTVADNGRGLPEDFTLDAADRLGLQIVRTLAAGELRGSIE